MNDTTNPLFSLMSKAAAVLLAACLSVSFLGAFGTYAYAEGEDNSSDTEITDSDNGSDEIETTDPSESDEPAASEEGEGDEGDEAEDGDDVATTTPKPAPVPTKAGWLQDTAGTWYYFTSVNAKPSTGWILSNGKWYWLSPGDNGAMATSQFIDDNGTLYYMDAEGIMLTGWFKVEGDWYFANKSGAVQTGWVKSGGKWYWLMPDEGGKMAESQWIVDGKDRYYLTDKGPGQMATGWFTVDGDWYYASPSGAQQMGGWVKSGKNWYWLLADEGGKMAQNQWITDKGVNYYLTNKGPGQMATGWFQDAEGDWYYASASGAQQKSGWVKSGKNWYFLDGNQNGKMAQNQWIEDKGKRYYLTDKGPGQMATGWIAIGNDWYYADSSGAQQREGWLKSGGKWYWLQGDKEGLMYAGGFKDIDGQNYYFSTDGAMAANTSVDLGDEKVGYANGSGSISYIGTKEDGKLILRNDAGEPLTGWQQISGAWFYGDEGGVAHVGWLELGGKWYWMDNNGVMAVGSRTIDGRNYVFNSSGVWVPVSAAHAVTYERAVKELNSITNSSMTKEQKLRAAYNHIRDDFREYNPRIPHMKQVGWESIYADDIFVGRGGNCLSCAAAMAFMAKAIGYENVYACNSGGHGWAEIDGLVYDPEWERHNSGSYYARSYSQGGGPAYAKAISSGAAWMRVAI